MNREDKTLISFSGRDLVDINFAPAEAKKRRAYRKACNKAKAAKKPAPPEGDGKFVRATQGQVLSLRPGTTATVTGEELAFIKSDYPAAFRCVTVHPGVAGKPSRAERKAAAKKSPVTDVNDPRAKMPELPPSPEDSKGKGKGKGKGSKATVSTG